MADYRYNVKIICDCKDWEFPYNAVEVAQSWFNQEHVPVGSEEYEMFADQIDGSAYHPDAHSFAFTVDGCGQSDVQQLKNGIEHTAHWLMKEYPKVVQVDTGWTRIKDTPDGEMSVKRDDKKGK